MPDAASSRPSAATASTAATMLPWVAILLAAATLAWLIAGLDRGLELTDESFYLLSAIHAADVRLFFTPAHWVTGALWRASGSLIAFRAAGLALAVLPAMLLAWGLLRVAPLAKIAVPSRHEAKAAVVATAASGALLYGSLLSFTPSYNLLAASGACLAMGAGLLSIASTGGRARALEILAGAALGVTVLSKFSAGIGTAGLLVILQLALGPRPLRRWGILLVTACAFATVALAALIETGVEEAVRQHRAGVEMIWAVQGDEGVRGRLLRSAADLGGMLVDMAAAFWGPLACFALGLYWRPVLLGSLGIGWWATLLVVDGHLGAGMSRYAVQAQPLAAALAFGLMASWRRWTGTPSAVLLALTFCALPVAVALGTSNPLQTQILAALAPWGALLALLCLSDARPSWPAAMVSLLFSGVVLFQVIANGSEPYRARPLREQTQPVSIGDLGTVKVDPKTAAMVRDLQLAARRCGIQAGAPFLDFYNIPAAALVVRAVPIESPWLLGPSHGALVLKRADPDLLRRAVVAVKLESSGAARPKPPAQLASFPAGFTLCGTARAPLDDLPIELWAPASR